MGFGSNISAFNVIPQDFTGLNQSFGNIQSATDLTNWGDKSSDQYGLGKVDFSSREAQNYLLKLGMSQDAANKFLEYQQLKKNPYASQITGADAQINTAKGLYNPYIQAGQEALGKYQALYQQPLNYQYAPNQGQQNQLNQIGFDINNQTTLGNQQINANAAMTGGLYGGNRIRAQGQMAQELQSRGNQMQGQLNDQFAEQGYQSAYGDRQAQLGLLGQTINQGQAASQGLGETITNMHNLQGQLYQGYGNQTAQAILAEQQRRDQERAGNAALLTAGLGLVGTVAGGPLGGAVGTGIGTAISS